MLSALKKNDRVVTIGGMIGTVANITPDGQEVTLKVDDNTRIRMIRSSIQRVLSGDGEAEKTADSR
jgi:preprotein translocase subunit YajC